MMDLITLVERATQGDAAALGHLVTEHWRFVYTMCLSHVGHTADAEDLHTWPRPTLLGKSKKRSCR
jgi:hypothetical protein